MDDSIKNKVNYVLSQTQSRDHSCHWPGCNEQVPPAKWGCRAHWFSLPKELRDKIWEAYKPGQEITFHVSDEYLQAAREVQDWIQDHLKSQVIHTSEQSIEDTIFNLDMSCFPTYVTSNSDVPIDIPGDTFYVDLETYGHGEESALNIHSNHIRLISVTNGDGPTYVFDMYHLDLNAILTLLSHKTLVGHNLLFDLPILIRHGLPYPPTVKDTMVESMILFAGLPEEYTSNLKFVLDYFLKVNLAKEHGASNWRDIQLSQEQIHYAANDVSYLPALQQELEQRLDKWNLTTIANLENGIIPAIVDMTLRGVRVDVEAWRARSQVAVEEEKRLSLTLHTQLPTRVPLEEKVPRVKKDGSPYASDVRYNARIAEKNKTRQWNLGSQKQMIEAFELTGIKLPADEDGKKNTRYETLVDLQADNPILVSFLQWREKQKEATTFGEEWLRHLRGDRVHPNWRQLGAQNSGRMSCGNPNLQQIPRGHCRKGLIASEGCLLIRADFSQIEARIAAKISGDLTLTKLFHDGGDIHKFTARAVLGKEDITPEDRQIGKSLLFGLLFSMSAPHLREYCATNYGVKFTLEQAQTFRNRFFRTFAGLANWHARNQATCQKKREFRSIMGRRRLVAWSKEFNVMGVALNHPVQATAADMLKLAVHNTWDRRNEQPDAKLLMLVHDEIVLEGPETKSVEIGEWLKGIMIDAGNQILSPIPVEVEVKIGKSWGG